MTARFSHKYIDNLPRVPVKCYEYTVTVAENAVNGRGDTIDRVVIYATPLEKDDLVVLYADSNSEGEIVVSKYIPGDDVDQVHGILIDNPEGNDDTTANGGTPAHAQRRTASVAFFGDAVDDRVDAEGTMTAAYGCGWGESAATPTLVPVTSTPTAGAIVALASVSSGARFPALYGFNGYGAKD
jgi:hypothetical protein